MIDYSTYDKVELLKIIAKQEKEIKHKKYGLIWDSEREPEQVVLDCKNNLPILKRIKNKEIKTNKNEDNILIEGDNYHALTVLNYTHKEKIDVIYIDPPYNTGKEKEWKYNDRFIDENDGYRHSKWLNLFEKRLKLARNLLTENGVILISIDDNEVAQTRLVCDKIFNGNGVKKNTNFVGTLIWDLGTGTSAGHFTRSHEYILCYSKNKSKLPNFSGGKGIIDDRALKKISNKNPPSDFTFPKGTRVESSTDFDLLNEWGGSEKTKLIDGVFSCKNGQLEYDVTLNAGWTQKKQMRSWFSGEKTLDSKGQEVVEFYFRANGKIYCKKNREKINPPTILRNIASTKTGSSELKELFGGESVFDFPKPSILIKELLSYFPKDIIVLDYFAGTGTTGHAVLNLNEEDKGTRKFILCTNNENNICTEVTYPRIKKIIKGYNKNNKEQILGLEGNLQYFKTALIKKANNRDQVKINLTRKCTELLCVKENIFNLEQEEDDFKIFSSNIKDKFLCIYYNFIDDSFDNFLEHLAKLKHKKIIYMFSPDNVIDKSIFSSIHNIRLELIPQEILTVYRQLVKMNIPIKPNVIFTDFNKAKTNIFDIKDKDDGARVLRVVLEKVIQKISQNNSINILTSKGKEEKISVLNDKLYNSNIISQVDYTENKTFLTIGNNAAHGDYGDYELKQVENFYKHIQSLLNNYSI